MSIIGNFGGIALTDLSRPVRVLAFLLASEHAVLHPVERSKS